MQYSFGKTHNRKEFISSEYLTDRQQMLKFRKKLIVDKLVNYN